MPKSSSRFLWSVLSGMLIAGMACLALLVWSLGAVLSGGTIWIFLPIAGAAFVGFLFLALLAMGIVYRVDRLRGEVTHRVRMFE
ncbi:MAG: hypothetical protein M1144_03485 [Candidatus Thermoplasmatota archaeon]|nr:hypothetical protein [Candidatus Thermoplasmatota archaeon]MCL5984100.1 hypothetical protein [Candidatus Thermoplasmatota archaeon]